jgi:uncharacterized protein YfcZ (UPF0381/DUF406 family)
MPNFGVKKLFKSDIFSVDWCMSKVVCQLWKRIDLPLLNASIAPINNNHATSHLACCMHSACTMADLCMHSACELAAPCTIDIKHLIQLTNSNCLNHYKTVWNNTKLFETKTNAHTITTPNTWLEPNTIITRLRTSGVQWNHEIHSSVDCLI